MNVENGSKWEVVLLSFIDVLSFRFIENLNTSSTVINSALLKNEGHLTIIDFFPIIWSNSLQENIDSDFIIKSRRLTFTVLEDYKL